MNEGQKLDRLAGRPTSKPIVRTEISIPESDRVSQAEVAGEFERGAGDTFPVHLTDTGNAQLLVRAYGATLRYCFPWKTWLIWDGVRWKRDDTGLIHRRAKETVRLMYVGAAGVNGDAVIDQDQAKHALRSESVRALNAMVDLARSEPGLPVLPGDLDADLWKLNVFNGTIDLRTGKLGFHSKRDLITKLAPVIYDPNAKCPRWEAFLNRIMDSNQRLIDFLQRAVGYSLTGDTSERALFFLHGTGANGKSTYLETLRALMGDYGLRTPTETLLTKRGSEIPNDIARLQGARFVTAAESGEGRRLAEAAIKDLTGNDTITARFLHAEFFDFKPESKIWFASNHKPVVRGTDQAIWDRIKLIPFNVVIPEADQNKHLIDELREEVPGILAWAVRGCLAWQENGLGVPDEVKEATAEYRDDSDVIAQYIGDRCTVGKNLTATAKALYANYKVWTEENGERPASKQMFGRKLTEHGFMSQRTKHARIWIGIGLSGDSSIFGGDGSDG